MTNAERYKEQTGHEPIFYQDGDYKLYLCPLPKIEEFKKGKECDFMVSCKECCEWWQEAEVIE